MAMTMTGEVQLPASRETVWTKLNEPAVLRSCIPGCEQLDRNSDTQADFTSSVQTLKLTSVLGPNVVLIATSIASRPLAISTRPIRGTLFRASKIYQRPPRYASNQAAKSIGP